MSRPARGWNAKTSNGEKYHHFGLLAKNEAGYKNLIKLTTAAHLDGYYYKPRIDKELLAKHGEGLIAMSGCLASEIPDWILKDQLDRRATRWIFSSRRSARRIFFSNCKTTASLNKPRSIDI